MQGGKGPDIAVSTWSLHRALGVTFPNSPAADVANQRTETYGPAKVELLDLPAACRRNGFDRLEIVHFQMPSRDKAYLRELKASAADSGVHLQTLLIDNGDVGDGANQKRDIAWLKKWIDAAAELGTPQARVSAGRQKPSKEALDHCIAGLRELLAYGKQAGVRIITENWQELTPGPKEVNTILDGVGPEIGFIADFGNWKGPTKYTDLAQVMNRATETHANGHFTKPGVLDTDDYGKTLDVAVRAGFKGPHVLIYSSPWEDDEWAALRQQRDFLRSHLAVAA
jgi:sugar phosphate isomerase/epimerase